MDSEREDNIWELPSMADYPIVCWGRQFSWHSERACLLRLVSGQEVLTITCFRWSNRPPPSEIKYYSLSSSNTIYNAKKIYAPRKE